MIACVCVGTDRRPDPDQFTPQDKEVRCLKCGRPKRPPKKEQRG